MPSTLSAWFNHVTEQYKHKSAFTFQNTTLSYERLSELSTDFAAYLQSRPELEQGDYVAVCLKNCLQFPVVALGIWKAGLVLVNTSPYESTGTLNAQLKEAGVKAIILSEQQAEHTEAKIVNTDIKRVIFVEETDMLPWPRSLWRHIGARSLKRWVAPSQSTQQHPFVSCLHKGGELQLRWVAPKATDVALIQYTSGVTGPSKAVCLSHKNLLSNAAALGQRVFKDATLGEEVAVCPLPVSHIYPLSLALLVLPSIGAHVVLTNDVHDTEAVTRELMRWPASVFVTTNSMLASINALPNITIADFVRLNITVSGLSPLTPSTLLAWEHLTQSNIFDVYGLTEGGAAVTIRASSAQGSNALAAMPVAGVELRVLNEQGAQALIGECGVLWVKGESLMVGYLSPDHLLHGQTSETSRGRAESAKIIPEQDENGWFSTGDIVRVLEGQTIEFMDRESARIHRGNFCVYPSEIERMVSAHIDIVDCVAVNVSPDEGGGAQEQIKLFVVSKNKQMTVKDVRDYARERLTSYKVPQQVEFRAQLPKNAFGRVMRSKIKAEELNRLNRKRRLL